MSQKKEIRNTYFKIAYHETMTLVSGMKLPDPENGPYKFIDCDIHPRLWETMQQLYATSEYINTYVGYRGFL